MCRLFEAQFKTTDEYRDWRLKFLPVDLNWRGAPALEMPAGLPIKEIRRRLSAARELRLPGDWRPPSQEEHTKVHCCLTAEPDDQVIALAGELRASGGDYV